MAFRFVTTFGCDIEDEAAVTGCRIEMRGGPDRLRRQHRPDSVRWVRGDDPLLAPLGCCTGDETSLPDGESRGAGGSRRVPN